MRERVAWGLVAALGLAVVLTFAGVVRGGPLDPADPPGPTYRTLGDLAPSWHQSLSATGGCTSARFTCVLASTAVLDNETGVVWEKQISGAFVSWDGAMFACHGLTKGGKTGWRLPTIEELMSLWDVSVTSAPRLPSGHPFSDILALSTDRYWTQSTWEPDALQAYAVSFAGSPATTIFNRAKSEPNYVWCVRGGAQHDGR